VQQRWGAIDILVNVLGGSNAPGGALQHWTMRSGSMH
jgi:hypothetical protein